MGGIGALDGSTVDYLTLSIIKVGLVSFRIVGFFLIAPIFSSRAVPRNIRAALIISLASVVALIVDTSDQEFFFKFTSFIFLSAKEFFIGLLLGIFVWLPMRGIEYAGVILDTQAGSTTAQDFDIIFNAQTTPTAILLSQTLAAYFFSVGGFLVVCDVLFQSYLIWSVVDFFPRLSLETASTLFTIAGKLLLISFLFILPISGFMFLADITIAFIAKMAPTLNALTFSMPVKSAIMLVMLVFYIDLAFPAVMEQFYEAIPSLQGFFTNDR